MALEKLMVEAKLVEGFPRYLVHSSGVVISTQKKEPKILTPMLNTHGYLTVDIRENGLRKMRPIHRLVAETFIPRITGKNCVNHKDGNQKNNNVENLEWCTSGENLRHHFRTLKRNVGDEHWHTQILSKDYQRIKEMRASGMTFPAIAKIFNTKVDPIRRVVAYV